ncbi:hypothetical protein D9613_011440 [Agrocybe pediades]|uniref:F-box domain-containing protein n=1 Tax=Agrocybe pediades TaxID=84607 RepID=A0A8H4QSP3_9AGAR|nr:hypothetical protein D9613_011440 [Agrocybe pediades]
MQKNAVNQARCSFNRTLPVEVVTSIFRTCIQHAIDTSDRVEEGLPPIPSQSGTMSVPLKIGAVCALWRRVAWSTPYLWTTISIAFFRTSEPEYVQLLREWLNRSGTLPIDITVYTGVASSTAPAQPLIQMLAASCKRWHSACLRLPLTLLRNIFAVAQHLPTIDSLEVVSSQMPSDEEDRPFWTTHPPAPKSIRMVALTTKQLNVRWEVLTHANLAEYSTERCLEFLRCAPMLESCHFYSVVETVDTTGQLESAPILVHHNIRQFGYNINTYNKTTSLLAYVSMPKLVYFRYRAISITEVGIPDFLDRSQCRLTHLDIDTLASSFVPIFQILTCNAAASITHLIFQTGATSGGWDMPGNFLAHLADASMLKFEDKDGKPVQLSMVPRLEVIKYNYTSSAPFPWKYVPDIFKEARAPNTEPTLVEGTEGDHPTRRPLRQFHVLHDSPRYHADIIKPEIFAPLMAAREAGYDIRYEDFDEDTGKMVDLFGGSLYYYNLRKAEADMEASNTSKDNA